MFSGIVESIGRIHQIQELQKGRRFFIEAPVTYPEELKAGHSIAVNGVCLTVAGWQDHIFWSDVSIETLEKSCFGNAREGDNLNLERALKFSDRINGHWVTGHMDGTGRIDRIERLAEFSKFTFELPRALSRDVVQKGSIAIDGISLTVNHVSENTVEVMIIPSTLQKTTLGQKKPGDKVQIELDLIGKYIKKWANM